MKLSKKDLIIGSATTLLVLSVVSTVFFLNTSADNLYKKYYKPFESASFTQRSAENNTVLKLKGIRLYLDNDYPSSISIFTMLKEEQVLTSETSFFLGLAYLGNEEYENASIIFNDHLHHFTTFLPEVKWYLGLSYLQLGERGKAKDLFSELSAYNGKFGREARRIEQILIKDSV